MRHIALIKHIILFLIITSFQSCDLTHSSDNKTQQKESNKNSLNDTVEQLESKSSPANNSISEDSTHKNKFEEVIKNVAQIDYALKEYEELDKSKDFLTARINAINKLRTRSEKELIKQVNTTNIIKVRKAFIKGTKELSKNLYERAGIESWEVKNVNEAVSIFSEIEQIQKSNNWEAISKSPITCFRVKNEIIFITPGGFYMLDKVTKIESFLKDNL